MTIDLERSDLLDKVEGLWGGSGNFQDFRFLDDAYTIGDLSKEVIPFLAVDRLIPAYSNRHWNREHFSSIGYPSARIPIDRYAEDELFDDSEIEEERCSMKATSHCGAMIASYMVAVFNNYVANFIEKGNFREVPFKMYYDLPTLTNTIEL